MSDVPEDFKLTICDKCSATFTIEIMERTFDESVIQMFFICPNCGKEYTVLITDKELREKIGKRKRLSRALLMGGKALPKDAFERKLRELEDMKNDIQLRADALKSKYLKGDSDGAL